VNRYSLSHLSNPTLRRDLAACGAHDCHSTANYIAYIAEFDARRLYAEDGYPSMFNYCVHVLHLSVDAALMRIRAARLARQLPALFVAIAEGRLHVTAVVRIGKHLTEANADQLIAAATHKTREQIETLMARRFPRADVPTRLEPIPPAVGAGQAGTELGPDRVGGMQPERAGTELGLEPVRSVPTRPRVTPLAPERFALQVTIGQSARDKLRYAQELISHQLPSGDMVQPSALPDRA
jgi:hypothetical protein